MKGYSKIKGNTSFIPRSNSNKEFLFVDKDFDELSSNSINRKPHLNEQEPSIIDERDYGDDKKNDFFIAKSEENDDLRNEDGERIGGVLWRNLSVSSATTPPYQKSNIKGNNKNNNNSSLERQNSTRSIQEAVKRAFSIKRSSSVNYDRYCRIYDQPMNGDDECDDYSQQHDHDDFEKKDSFGTRSVSMMKKNNGRKHVGSKVVRACKRLFSR